MTSSIGPEGARHPQVGRRDALFLECQRLVQIDTLLQEVERLAWELRADPENHVRRSSAELRLVFASRGSVELAVERMRGSLRLLKGANREGARREFQRRTPSLDRLEHVLDDQLVPHLRGVGFDV